MRNFNFFGFITLYGILFLIILYKVLNVPVTTDELPTYFFYSRFSFWEIMMFPDNIPNYLIVISEYSAQQMLSPYFRKRTMGNPPSEPDQFLVFFGWSVLYS
jgi:hypothetical protein